MLDQLITTVLDTKDDALKLLGDLWHTISAYFKHHDARVGLSWIAITLGLSLHLERLRCFRRVQGRLYFILFILLALLVATSAQFVSRWFAAGMFGLAIIGMVLPHALSYPCKCIYLRLTLQCENCSKRPFPWNNVRVQRAYIAVFGENGYIRHINACCDACLKDFTHYEALINERLDVERRRKRKVWLKEKSPAFVKWLRRAPLFPHSPEEYDKAYWDRTVHDGRTSPWLECSGPNGSIELFSSDDILERWMGHAEPPNEHQGAFSCTNRYINDSFFHTGSVFRLEDGRIVIHWKTAGHKFLS